MSNNYNDEPTPMDVDCSYDDKKTIDKLLESKRYYKKRTIPKSLKINVWNYYIGKDIGSAKCMCCRQNEIIQGHFEAGHVISEKDGGATNIENLRPICSLCNKSMCAQNMLEFMRKCGYKKPNNWNGKTPCLSNQDIIIID